MEPQSLLADEALDTAANGQPYQHTLNIVACLPRLAEQQPNAIAAVIQTSIPLLGAYRYKEINFCQLERLSRLAAAGLQAYGIANGTKTILMVKPSIEFFVLAFALMRVGAIPILIDPGMGLSNLKSCIDHVEPRAFIGITKAHIARVLLGWGNRTIDKWVTVGRKVGFSGITYQRLLSLGQQYESSNKADSTDRVLQPDALSGQDIVLKKPDELAAILYTSGSTGVPKGVEYTHAMFAEQVRVLRYIYGIKPGERDLATFPLFSLFGPALGMASIVPAINASKPITANPQRLVAAIKDYQCTNMFVSPALVERLANDQSIKQHDTRLSSINRVISAGAPARHDSLARFHKLLSLTAKLFPSYGATEALPVARIDCQELMDTRELTDIGSGICVGYPIDGLSVDVIGTTDQAIPYWSDSLPLKVGKIGEIVVRGRVVSRQYHSLSTSDRLSKIKSDDGFYHRMGDLGYFDEMGRLWMCGRKKHRVETQQGVLYSIPCERIFDTHPQVKRTALVGVPCSYDSRYCDPVLCVELAGKFGISLRNKIKSDLLALGRRYEMTKAITLVLFHPSFPVDVRHNAKIFREQLAEWAANQVR